MDISTLKKLDLDNCSSIVKEEAQKTLKFLQECLANKTFPHEDYKEFCELAVLYLGGHVDSFKFQTPGPVHHARFMAKAIYYLKMSLLFSQLCKIFHPRELVEIEVMSEFTAVFYSKWWFKGTLAAVAPSGDLWAIQSMTKLKEVSPGVALPCLLSLKRHPWYLTKELVILCLADKELSCPIKKAMALALFKCERPASLAPGKPKFPQEVFSEEFQEKHKDNILSGLVDLIGPELWTIPILLGLSEDDMVWVQLEVHQWDLISGFKKVQRFVSTFSVVNDSAERGVKLIEDFVLSSTDEKLRQDMMLTVSHERKRLKANKLTKKQLKEAS